MTYGTFSTIAKVAEGVVSKMNLNSYHEGWQIDCIDEPVKAFWSKRGAEAFLRHEASPLFG